MEDYNAFLRKCARSTPRLDCQEQFEPQSEYHIYCSPRCRQTQAAHRRRLELQDADCSFPDGCETGSPVRSTHVEFGPVCLIHNYRLQELGEWGDSGRERREKGNGRWMTSEGYVMVTVLGRGEVLEHRLIIEEEIGRELTPQESVHHINKKKADNRRENLQLRSSQHGRGVAAHCGDCGSINIEFDELKGNE